MSTLNTETLSPFGRWALQLDTDLTELKRLGAQIERLEIESDSGLEHALKLLAQFAHRGENITQGIQGFAQTLQDARSEAEAAATMVAARAQEIQARKQLQDQMQERISMLGKRVKEVSDSMTGIRKSEAGSLSEDPRITEQLREMDARLAEFVAEAQAIQLEARESHMRSIERNAESLFGTLQSARRKLGTVIPIAH